MASPHGGWAGLLPAELADAAGLSPAFRGRQAFRWIARGAFSWDEMSDLPESERIRLQCSSPLLSSSIHERLGDADGSVLKKS